MEKVENNYLRDLIKENIFAAAPITAKEIHAYLHNNGIECDMYEVAEQLNALIRSNDIDIGDEGNTFQAH